MKELFMAIGVVNAGVIICCLFIPAVPEFLGKFFGVFALSIRQGQRGFRTAWKIEWARREFPQITYYPGQVHQVDTYAVGFSVSKEQLEKERAIFNR